ncbi:MAG: APC family permease [Myxococcota bacterium]|nr:APC family permease [Myxococcota bacterium]
MTKPLRQLGLTVTAAIVVANMIGTGVFTSTGFQAASLHDPLTILACWVIGGIVALCGAATYAELGSMMPKAGGEYVYLREAYHPAVGFMSGWVSLTAGFSAPIAVAALAFSRYLGTIVPGVSGAPWAEGVIDLGSIGVGEVAIRLGPGQAVAMALIIAIAGLHSFDAKIGGWVQAAFTAAKVLLIVLFILGGLLLGEGNWDHFETQGGGMSNIFTTAFATSLMYVSFAYSGWNAAAYIAGEVREPSRTIPRALLLGTGSVMVLYVLLNLVFLYAVPTSVLAGAGGGGPVFEVGDVAARALFGNRAGQLVTSVIALALVSAVSAMVMAGPRVYAAMARDHALPHQLAHHNARGVPVFAVITQGVLGCLFVLVGDPDKLIRFVGFTLALFTGLAVGAVFILRARGMTSEYKTTGYPVTPLLFIALSAWIVYAQIKDRPVEAIAVGVVLALGALVYWITVGRKPPVEEA